MKNKNFILLAVLLVITSSIVVYSADAAGIPKKAISTVARFLESDLPTTTVFTDTANTYTAGQKQTFQNSATTSGTNLAPSSDPSTLANGDLWLSSTDTDVLKYRSSATTYSIQSTKGVATSITKTTPGTGTTSTTFVAAGLGAAVTPVTTGRILVVISVNVLSGTSLDGANIQIMHGTGTAPTHNTAPSGQTNDCIPMDVRSTGTVSPGGTGTISCVITSLTLGTTYWVDLEYDTDTSTKTATLNNAIVSIIET